MIDPVHSLIHANMHPINFFLRHAHKLRAGIPAPPLIDELSLPLLLDDVFLEKRLQLSLGLVALSDQLLFTFVLEELFVLLAVNFGEGVLRTLPLHRLSLGVVHEGGVRGAISRLIERLASLACRRRTLLFGCRRFVD